MRRFQSLVVLAAIAATLNVPPAEAAALGSCTGGLRTATDFIVTLNGDIENPIRSFFCGPTQQALARTAGPAGAAGIGAAAVGASAGAGALVAEDGVVASAYATASFELEFMVRTLTGTPPLLVQVHYQADLITLGIQSAPSGGSNAELDAEGFANVFNLATGGEAGGVPVEHRNGVNAGLAPGDIVPLDTTTSSVAGVSVVPDTPYSIELLVSAYSRVAGGIGTTGSGSASAEISAAIALVDLFVAPFPGSERFEVEFAIAADPSAQLPGADVYPMIASPLSLVEIPLPGSAWLLGSALGSALLALRRRRHAPMG